MRDMKLKTIISNSFEPFLNLAVEDWLFQHCEVDSVICYLWRNERTVVVGQNQNPFAECNVDLLEGEGGHLMRRTTGGGAVYHDVENLNFTFVSPVAMSDIQRNFSVIAAALDTYGIKAEVSGRNDMQCEGRKFSGSAFHKSSTTALHHGTIMIRTDIECLRRYLTPSVSKLMKHGVKSVESRVVNLSELSDITVDSLMPRIVEAFDKEYGQKSELSDFGVIAHYDEVRQRRDFYASDEWRFGKWRDFKSTCNGSFGWGTVEVSLLMDASTIVDCQIASDALDVEAVNQALRLIKGSTLANLKTVETNNSVVADIIKLIIEKQ